MEEVEGSRIHPEHTQHTPRRESADPPLPPLAVGDEGSDHPRCHGPSSSSSPLSFSISQNMMRRHLTPGQKAGVAAKAEPLFAAQAKQRKAEAAAESNRRRARPDPVVADLPQPGSPPPDLDQPATKPKKPRAPLARDLAAEATGASGRGTAQFKRVEQEAPDLAAQVMAGAMALDRAERCPAAEAVLRSRAPREEGRHE